MIVVLGNSKNQVLLFFEYIEKGTPNENIKLNNLSLYIHCDAR